MKKRMSFGSRCVHDIRGKRTTEPHALPIYPTSSFNFSSIDEGMAIFAGEQKGHIYGRFSNPTIDSVQEKIALLETHNLEMEARGMLVSSGMSAISTLMLSVLKAGDKVLTQGNIYGGTSELLTKVLAPLDIQTVLVNFKDLDQVETLVKGDPRIRMIYFETPANPTLACVDMEALAGIAQKYGRYTAADNTFATPYLQQPFRFGIDFVIHSTTKYLNGHGNSISGILLGRDLELMDGKVLKTMKLLGTNCNAWDAWLTNNGLKTLVLRMKQHCRNAMIVAEFLSTHEQVEQVNYIGLERHPDHALAQRQMSDFGGMLSFELKGGLKSGIRFMDRLEFCSLAPTLGDVDTLVLHPASMSHLNIAREIRLENGITDGLIRISVGIENVEDILNDLREALM